MDYCIKGTGHLSLRGLLPQMRKSQVRKAGLDLQWRPLVLETLDDEPFNASAMVRSEGAGKKSSTVSYACAINKIHPLTTLGAGYQEHWDINPWAMLTGVACL